MLIGAPDPRTADRIIIIIIIIVIIIFIKSCQNATYTQISSNQYVTYV